MKRAQETRASWGTMLNCPPPPVQGAWAVRLAGLKSCSSPGCFLREMRASSMKGASIRTKACPDTFALGKRFCALHPNSPED